MAMNDFQGSEAALIDAGREDAAAVAQAWLTMCAQPMDAALFLRLLGVCDFKQAEATVLWDLLRHHRQRASLDVHAVRSGVEYGQLYAGVTPRAAQRAVQSLSEQDLIIQAPVVRNVARKFRLNWAVLHERLSVVNPLIPGLGVDQSA